MTSLMSQCVPVCVSPHDPGTRSPPGVGVRRGGLFILLSELRPMSGGTTCVALEVKV